MKINDNIEITNEDNMKLMARYPDNYFDLAVVDPPYGINIAEWDTKKHRPKKEYFKELFRVSKNQIIWGGNYFTDKLEITEAWICWNKKPFLKQQAHFEMAWTSFDMKPKMIEYTYAGNAEGLTKVKVNYKKKSIHPTEKPSALYELIFRDYAKENYKIIDTYLGSGNIIKALDKVNKHDKMNLSIKACEIDKEYFEASIQSIKLETQLQVLF